MAYISINSKFTPFTYDELERPFKEYGEQYEKNSEAMATLGEQADIWKSLANQQTDPIAYGRYKAYADSLDTQVNSMAKNGLNAGTKQNIIDLRRRYSSEIRPIMKAYEDKQKEIERQSAMQDKDHSIMFSRNAQTTSLDDYLTGKITPYAQVSGTELAVKGSTLGQSISKRYFRTKEGRAFSNAYFNYINSQGYDSKQAAEILAREKNPDGTPKYPEFEKGINDLLGSTDVQQLSATDKQKALDNVMYGINTGITYDQKNQLLENWPMKMAMEEAAAARKARAAASPETLETGIDYSRKVGKTTVGSTAKYVPRWTSEMNFLNTVMQDPRRMTNIVNQNEYAVIAKEHGLTNSKYDQNAASSLMGIINGKIKKSAVESFSYPINIVDSKYIKQAVIENSRSFSRRTNNTGIYELEDNKKSKSALDENTFTKYMYQNVNMEFDPKMGVLLNSEDSSGKVHHMMVDPSLLGPEFRNHLANMNKARAAGDYESADKLRTGAIEYLAKYFNSSYGTQSSTEDIY